MSAHIATRIVCDRCKDKSFFSPHSDMRSARDQASLSGWTNPDDCDFCPKCSRIPFDKCNHEQKGSK